MKKNSIHIFYLISSILFTVQLLQHISDPGDQTWFAEQAKLFNYDYLYFAFHRYSTWSSRLLIESATMFFSTHYLLFKVVLFSSTYLLFYSLHALFKCKNNLFSYLMIMVFFILFPTKLFLGAGLIATITNYYFPLVAFVLAFHLLQKNAFVYDIISIVLFVFSFMSEQFAVMGFGIFFYLLVSHFISEHTLNIKNSLVFFASILGIISAKVSPGNSQRIVEETNFWYPEFQEMSSIEKIIKGLIATNEKLFFSSEFYAIILLSILLVVLLSYRKKKYVYIISSVLAILVIVSQYTLPLIPESYRDSYVVVAGIGITAMLCYLIYEACPSIAQSIFIIYLLGLGYGIRMLVSFSPTIYASGIRTFIPFIVTVFIASMILIGNILEENQH